MAFCKQATIACASEASPAPIPHNAVCFQGAVKLLHNADLCLHICGLRRPTWCADVHFSCTRVGGEDAAGANWRGKYSAEAATLNGRNDPAVALYNEGDLVAKKLWYTNEHPCCTAAPSCVSSSADWLALYHGSDDECDAVIIRRYQCLMACRVFKTKAPGDPADMNGLTN